jgi:hypothetical protein
LNLLNSIAIALSRTVGTVSASALPLLVVAALVLVAWEVIVDLDPIVMDLVRSADRTAPVLVVVVVLAPVLMVAVLLLLNKWTMLSRKLSVEAFKM